MLMPVEVTLRKLTWSAGIPQATAVSTPVIGFLSSATRSEFYQAKAAGITVTDELQLMSESYNNEQEVSIDGTLYQVVRVYKNNPHKVTLSLQRR